MDSAVETALRASLRAAGAAAGGRIAVGYSGGVDSTALLAALCAVGASRPLAIHVDHALRPAAELEEELRVVRANCAALGADLLVARVEGGAIERRAAESGAGIEATARAYRYAAFSGALRRTGSSLLLLAHTRDDQLETLLMRLLGGSSAEGLRGIPPANGPVLRPFLGLGKEALVEYVAARSLAFSRDSTNGSSDFFRNRIRDELVPLLDRRFPGWRGGLEATARAAAQDAEALAGAAAELRFVPSQDRGGRLETGAEALLRSPDGLAVRAILEAASRLTGRSRLSRRGALEALRSLRGEPRTATPGEAGPDAIASPERRRAPAAHAPLAPRRRFRGWGLELRIEGERLLVERGLDFPLRGGYFVKIDGPCRVAAGDVTIEARWTRGSEPGIRAGAFRFPLVVRSRRPGDAIALAGGGAKRLDELFAEWGVPERLRGTIPVLEDRDGIAAVLGSAAGGKDRYRRSSASVDEPLLSISVKGA